MFKAPGSAQNLKNVINAFTCAGEAIGQYKLLWQNSAHSLMKLIQLFLLLLHIALFYVDQSRGWAVQIQTLLNHLWPIAFTFFSIYPLDALHSKRVRQ